MYVFSRCCGKKKEDNNEPQAEEDPTKNGSTRVTAPATTLASQATTKSADTTKRSEGLPKSDTAPISTESKSADAPDRAGGGAEPRCK